MPRQETIDEATIAGLARQAGLDIPADRLALTAARLSEMYELAHDLDGLDLDGVAPAMSYDPRWSEESGS